MYAVIKTGGKQYRVAANDKIQIEKLVGNPGDKIEFAEVLMISNDGSFEIGAPFVAGATVAGEIASQDRGPKIIIFKKRRRKHYRRKNGHRQDLTSVTHSPTSSPAAPSPLRKTLKGEALMAHKKAGGSSRNGRDTAGRRLGVKNFGGENRRCRQHHHPPARHQVASRHRRRNGPRSHDFCGRRRHGQFPRHQGRQADRVRRQSAGAGRIIRRLQSRRPINPAANSKA